MTTAIEKTSRQIEVSRNPVSALGLTRWPPTHEGEEKWGHEMTETLLSLLTESQFSRAEREAFLAGNPPADTLRRFAELIIRQAGIYDWKILLSRPVRMMVAQWYEEGGESLELAKAFHDAIYNRKRIAHGVDKGKIIDPRWYSARKDAVGELRVLLHRFKDELTQRRHREPDWKEVCDWFRQEIEQSADALSWLCSENVDGLLWYLEYIGRIEEASSISYERFLRIRSGEGRAEDLFLGWGAWSEGVSENTFRQRLSQIGRSKKPRTFIRNTPTV